MLTFEKIQQRMVCRKGGGGGGSSGTVDYPLYMKKEHHKWLSHTGQDTASKSVNSTLNETFGTSPYGNEDYVLNVADGLMGTAFLSVSDLFADYVELDILAVFQATHGSLLQSSSIVEVKRANLSLLNEDIETEILPRYLAGARDMNSVMSSAFIIGQINLEKQKLRTAQKFNADIDFRCIELATTLTSQIVEWRKNVVIQGVEIARIYMAAKTQEIQFNAESAAKDALWDIRLWDYASHMIASIGGGVGGGGGEETSAVQNVLGGALSGAAAGAQIGTAMGGQAGGGWGALGGAIIGGVGGAFSK